MLLSGGGGVVLAGIETEGLKRTTKWSLDGHGEHGRSDTADPGLNALNARTLLAPYVPFPFH
jgi:hypothetical protein